jgi:hypothetical protein
MLGRQGGAPAFPMNLLGKFEAQVYHSADSSPLFSRLCWWRLDVCDGYTDGSGGKIKIW